MMIDLDDGFIEMLGGTKTVDENGKVSYGTERTEDGAQSKIRISVQSPYFSIDSKAGNRLLNIGDETAFEEVGDELEKGYYFKTDNYVPSTWTSDNIDWTAGSGMLIDLAQGKIDAYDFTLRGEDKDSKSYIKLSSLPNQMVKVFYRDTNIDDDSGLVVFEMGTDNYIMRSFNWWNRIEGGSEPLTGMEFNIRDGKFTAYSSNTNQAGKYIIIDASDSSGNYPLMIGKPREESFRVAWDGALKINNNAFNVDAGGNFWINGADLGSAIFSVTNQGIVSMKKGSIALGEITKDDGGKVTSFYVDDNGNLSIGGTAFSVNKDGEMTATSGTIGGWVINPSSLSKGVLTLDGTNGTITAIANGNTNFKIDGTTGLLQAVNATLTTLTVVDTLLVKSPSGTTNKAEFTVQGNTTISGDTTISGSISLRGDILMPYGDLCTAPKDENDKTTGAFISFGNGGGNIWVYGDFYIAANSSASSGQTGKLIVQDTAQFNKPDNVLFGTQTLAQYITTTVGLVTEGEITSIGYAMKASQLTKTNKTPYSTGSATRPVYFENGIPKECNAYPDLTDYATQKWVNDKGYLTSIPSEYITETELNGKGYITNSDLPNMDLYVLKTTFNEKVAELEAKIAALTPPSTES